MRRLVPLVSVLLAVLAGCGSTKKKETSATPTATASGQPADGCPEVDAPKPRKEGSLRKPTLKLDPEQQYTATVTTSCGTFTIALDVKRAPKTSANFASLARKGFFDKTIVHRVSPGVVQGGDPTGTGEGGPGYSIKEAPPADLTYDRGVVAMAKRQTEAPGTSGSQFFVATADSDLPPDYALVGKVTSGDDTIDAIATTPTDPNTEMPLSPVVIESVRVA